MQAGLNDYADLQQLLHHNVTWCHFATIDKKVVYSIELERYWSCNEVQLSQLTCHGNEQHSTCKRLGDTANIWCNPPASVLLGTANYILYM